MVQNAKNGKNLDFPTVLVRPNLVSQVKSTSGSNGFLEVFVMGETQLSQFIISYSGAAILLLSKTDTVNLLRSSILPHWGP
jgi:hypothetical protein